MGEGGGCYLFERKSGPGAQGHERASLVGSTGGGLLALWVAHLLHSWERSKRREPRGKAALGGLGCCTERPLPVGERRMGMDTLSPRMVVSMFTLVTSRRMRGRMRRRVKAALATDAGRELGGRNEGERTVAGPEDIAVELGWHRCGAAHLFSRNVIMSFAPDA